MFENVMFDQIHGCHDIISIITVIPNNREMV